jgi:hypothetical protein
MKQRDMRGIPFHSICREAVLVELKRFCWFWGYRYSRIIEEKVELFRVEKKKRHSKHKR